MHHLLPFRGVAHVAYLPAERILGVSKLARVVDFFARDLQLQERLTTQIAGLLQAQLKPKGLDVVPHGERAIPVEVALDHVVPSTQRGLGAVLRVAQLSAGR